MRFDIICGANDVEHRAAAPNHPWTDGQVERMNRTLEEAAAQRFHYDSHARFRTHLAGFVAAYNFARRLKTPSGLTAWGYIAEIRTSGPDRFIADPVHRRPGLNGYKPVGKVSSAPGRCVAPPSGITACVSSNQTQPSNCSGSTASA